VCPGGEYFASKRRPISHYALPHEHHGGLEVRHVPLIKLRERDASEDGDPTSILGIDICAASVDAQSAALLTKLPDISAKAAIDSKRRASCA